MWPLCSVSKQLLLHVNRKFIMLMHLLMRMNFQLSYFLMKTNVFFHYVLSSSFPSFFEKNWSFLEVYVALSMLDPHSKILEALNKCELLKYIKFYAIILWVFSLLLKIFIGNTLLEFNSYESILGILILKINSFICILDQKDFLL